MSYPPYNDGTSTQYQDQYNSYNPYTTPYTEEGDQNQPAPLQRAPTSARRPSVRFAPRRESNGFELGEFPQDATVQPESKKLPVRTLKDYRYGEGNLCTKGGRVRCIGRICCCSLMTTVFLIVSIVLALALWIRPPSISIGTVQPLSSSISAASNGLNIQLGVDISVANPNYFSVDFEKIELQLFYPINNTAVGGGTATNIDFKSRSLTNFTFPFTLSYNSSENQADAIISDIASKCGASGGTKSNLEVNYEITLGIHILVATVSPVISNTFSFPCPISASELSTLLGGLNLRNLD